jgi:catechol 2,3-dioxygenase-like lactoylglutathione lyase family enzyme
MITAIARVVLLCRSVAERREFWQAIGFMPVYEGQLPDGRPLLHLGVPTQDGVGLWLIQAEGDEQISRVGRQTGAQPALVLYSSDIQADVEAVGAAGGEVTGRGADDASAWAHVRDPDGNVVVITQLLV